MARLLHIRLEGIDEVLKNDAVPHKLIERYLRRAERYSGSFIAIGNNLFPFVRLPFLNYHEATLDLNEHGQAPGIVYRNFSCPPHVHYEDGGVCRIKRQGFVGKIY